MPKKKVDTQQGLRIELQESERDMLRFYSTSAAIKNVGIGVGAVALPACIIGAGVLIAAIFDKGYDNLAGDIRNNIKEAQNKSEAEWAADYQTYLEEFQRRKENPMTAGEAVDAYQESGIGNPTGMPWGAMGWLGDLFGTTSQSWYVIGSEGPEPLTYEQWREKTHPDRQIGLVNMIGNGMGRIITFGL